MSLRNKFLFSVSVIFLLCFPFPGNSQPEGGYQPGSPQGAVVTTLLNLYTYPTAISANGLHVAGTPFGGGASYYWSAATGIINISGDMGGIADDGKGTGTWPNPTLLYNGSSVNSAGTWLPATNQWTFLGMNPGSPTLFATDYNSGWDITADGTTIVGMQYYPGYLYLRIPWPDSRTVFYFNADIYYFHFPVLIAVIKVLSLLS